MVLGGTAIITEEAAPLIGGLRARAGHLHLTLVAFWIAGGTWGAGILLYFVGRWRGEWVRRRWPKMRTLILRVFRAVRRHPWRASAATRFAWGLRVTLPVACGAARVPLWVFAIGSGISALVWAFLFTLLGWGVGEGALHLVGHLRQYEGRIGLVMVLALIVLILVLHRRHMEEEVVEALEKDD